MHFVEMILLAVTALKGFGAYMIERSLRIEETDDATLEWA